MTQPVSITRDFTKLLHSRLLYSSDFIQAIIGPRQVGKTTGVKQVLDMWKGPSLYASADLPFPPDTRWLIEQWRKAKSLGPNTLLAIDEVQKIPRWGDTIKMLFDEVRPQRQMKIVLLGSASLSIQSELSEGLAGRYEILPVWHWTADECKNAFGWNVEQYLKYGGYPSPAILTDDPERWQTFIRDSILEPVISRDILQLRHIAKPSLFRQTLQLTLEYPSQEMSYQKILGQLQDKGNATTVKNYLEILEGAFIIKALHKYSTRRLSTKTSSPKILVLAPALSHAYISPERLSSDPSWRGRIFESAVGATLSRCFRDIYYWRDGRYEVDFVIEKDDLVIGIEVKSSSIKKTRGLEVFKKAFPTSIPLQLDEELSTKLIESPEPRKFIMELLKPVGTE